MKKSLLLIILVFSFLLNDVFAENVLVLTDPKSNETCALRVGSYLVFELKPDKSIHQGFIRGINDSSIVFDDSQVALSQMSICAGSMKMNAVACRTAKAVGHGLIYSGANVFDFGLDIIFGSEFCLWPVGGTISLTGAFISGMGYIFNWAVGSPEHAFRVRSYSGWNVSIMDEEDKQGTSGKQILPLKDSIPTDPGAENFKQEKRKKIKIYGDDVYSE